MTFKQSLVVAVKAGKIDEFGEQLFAVYNSTPRWRFIRRYHLERQLYLAALLRGVWYDGIETGQRRETATHAVRHR
jgi:hypothetical protein